MRHACFRTNILIPCKLKMTCGTAALYLTIVLLQPTTIFIYSFRWPLTVYIQFNLQCGTLEKREEKVFGGWKVHWCKMREWIKTSKLQSYNVKCSKKPQYWWERLQRWGCGCGFCHYEQAMWSVFDKDIIDIAASMQA